MGRLRIAAVRQKGRYDHDDVSLDDLRELAAFRAENGCAISLYLDLDPSLVADRRRTATRVHSLLDAGAKSHGATRPDLPHEVRSGLKADFERLGQFFDGEFDRDGAHGLAVFAAGLDNVWSVLPLPGRAGHGAVADDFLLAPLVPLFGRGDGALVVVVGREQGRVLALRDGRLEEIADRTRRRRAGTTRAAGRRRGSSGTSRISRTSTTGRSPTSWRRGSAGSAAAVRRRLRGGDPPRVRGGAPRRGRRRRDRLDDGRSPRVGRELYEAVVPLFEQWRARRERGVERWREETGKGARGASGWAETLEAAPTAGWSCWSTRRACRGTRSAAPPAGGRRSTRHLPAGRDDDGGPRRRARLAVRLTLAHGGDVLATSTAGSRSVEGIGAVLRF